MKMSTDEVDIFFVPNFVQKKTGLKKPVFNRVKSGSFTIL